MSVTSSLAPSRSITPFLTPNHTPFNTPIHSPGTTMLSEPTQIKRKREELTKPKEPKRPKNKQKAQKHNKQVKPQHSNQRASKQAEPEPKRPLNRHPITSVERPQSRFKLEVYPSRKIDGALTASDLNRELLFCSVGDGTTRIRSWRSGGNGDRRSRHHGQTLPGRERLPHTATHQTGNQSFLQGPRKL